MTYFDIDGAADEHGRRTIEIADGRKMTGRAYALTSWKPSAGHEPDRHAVMIDLGRHLEDENGRTVYRRADPAADEINVGVMPSQHSAIVARPVRVNGVAYTGTLYVEREYGDDGEPAGAWRMRDGYIHRADDYFGRVTDAARDRLHRLATDVAETLVTDALVTGDRERKALAEVEQARKQVREAEAELAEAQRRAAEQINAYEALTEGK